jgi:hypothetical protein
MYDMAWCNGWLIPLFVSNIQWVTEAVSDSKLLQQLKVVPAVGLYCSQRKTLLLQAALPTLLKDTLLPFKAMSMPAASGLGSRRPQHSYWRI